MAIQREVVVQTAEKYVQRGKIEPAIREYKKLLAENPNDINTLNRVGDLYARIQRIDEAVDFFTQIAEQYGTEGFFVKAIAIYKKIIKLDPTRLEVYEKLAELYHKQGLITEARTQYQVLADYYQKHANAPGAIAIYQKMVELEPDNPSYHVKLAEIYQQQQLVEKAMGEYRIIAEMMLSHGRAQEAAQVYERALGIDSGNISFITDAVLKLRQAGNAAGAARFLAAAVERNPQAERVARLSRMDEGPAVEAAPARTPVPAPAPPAPAPAPPPAAAAPPPRPRPVPPPRPEPEPEIDIDLEIELEPSAALFDSTFPELSPAPPPRRDTATFTGMLDEQPPFAMEPAPAPAARARPDEEAPESEEIELSLDEMEVFVLDMEDDAEPPSLVKPPADMPRIGTAWIQAEEEAAAPAAAAAAESGEIDLGDAFALEMDEQDLPPLEASPWLMEETELAGPSAMDAVQAPEEVEFEIDPDLLERTAAEVQPTRIDRDEDLVSEAEVLAKYGLEEKAMDRLQEALRLRPTNLGAYSLMVQLHLEKGRRARAVEVANQMAAVAAEARDRDVWPKTRRQLLEAGFWVEGNRVALREPEEEAPPAPEMEVPQPELAPPEPWQPEPLDLDLDLELELELDPAVELALLQPEPLAPPLPEPPPEPLPEPLPEVAAAPKPAPAPPRRTKSADVDQMLRGLLDQPTRTPARRPAAPPPAAPVPAASPPVAAAPAPPVAPAAAPAAPARPIFNPLEIGEMIEAEDFDDDWTGGTGGAALGASEAALGTGFAAVPPPAAPEPPSPTLDDSGMSWLDEADQGRSAETRKASAGLFDEEDDFFDLAAQLEEELSQEDVFRGGDGMLVQQAAEQSLEEIVEGFKKGVAEHLSPTDYDTHFNLGIAYREMGLLDEAIGEFQLAAKDARYLVHCCSMLGLCFLDKGLPELAVKWYNRGLEAPGVSEDDTLGLLYDLGCVYVQTGDSATAYKTFVELYGINTNYRDVVARIEELGRPR